MMKVSKVSEAANRNENVMPLAWAKSGASLRLSRFYFRLSTNAAQNFLFDECALGVSVYLRECHRGTVLWIFRCDFATSEKGLGGAIWRGWECGRLQGTDGSFGWKSLGLSVISQRNMHGMWRLKRGNIVGNMLRCCDCEHATFFFSLIQEKKFLFVFLKKEGIFCWKK